MSTECSSESSPPISPRSTIVKDLHHFENVDEIREKYAAEIAEIRSKLEGGEEPVDVIVYRYLCGYKYKIDKAAAALKATLAYREEYGTAGVRQTVIENNLTQRDFPHFDKLAKCYPHNICHGVDKKGQPLSIERLGHTKPAVLTSIITLEEFTEYHLYHMEKKATLMAKLTETRGEVMRTCKIMDLDGLNASMMTREGVRYFKFLIGLSQSNYPEMLGNLYIIRAPWVFKIFWKVVKPWLSAATLEKIRILGNDWQDVLLENIDPEHLPDWAGGSCSNCPDGCVVEVDPSLGMQEVAVNAKQVHEEKVSVSAGDQVAWEFRTAKRDIGFCVTFQAKADDTENVELVPMERLSAQHKTQTGVVDVKCDGVVVLQWDNSFSRWTGKTLTYRVDHVPSSESVSAADGQEQG